MNEAKERRVLLILGDSPTKPTGFGRVICENLKRWMRAGAFDEIHVWGIGYWGSPHEFHPVKIMPAASPSDHNWASMENLARFVNVMASIKPTHLWMLQDVWGISPLRQSIDVMRTESGMKSFLYFPVDAPLEPEWTAILAAADHAVPYNDYGRSQAVDALLKKLGDKKLDRSRSAAADAMKTVAAIPHGVDSETYHPLGEEAKLRIRKNLFGGAVKEGDFLMVNVNSHQRRKGVVQSLQILAELRENHPCGMRAKLYMHMEETNGGEQSSLSIMAAQLGLVPGLDVFFCDEAPREFFKNGHSVLAESGLNEIYNAADLLLTTSYGEGWGLPISEAMCCGVPVAGPDHTAVAWQLSDGRGILLPVGQMDHVPLDNSRLRPRTDVARAAEEIALNMTSLDRIARAGHSWITQPCFRWENIALEWLNLMGVAEVHQQEPEPVQ